MRAVESVVIATASYYHLKHLIIKDVNYGIIGCLRKYNLLALIYALMSMTEMVMNTFPAEDYVLIVFYGLMSLLMLSFMPALERGVKKWTT